MTRRTFLQQTTIGALACAAGSPIGRAAAGSSATMTAAVIGHTGRGNFGHALDLIFEDRPGIELVAIADPDPAGRAKAQERTRARRSYADYREMLEKERPQLVCVAPRLTDQRRAMVGAALAIGAHVYCEKPFTRTLDEADQLLALAERSRRKIAVAHQGRLAPQTLLLKQRIDDGLMGELLEIRVHGKQDKRAGGEDLVVLGTHQFDLVRFFAGNPQWCAARVLQRGHEITRADAHAATEDIGPIAGDEIEAMFALPNGVNAHYTSRARNAANEGPWGMEFIGSRGRARLLNDVPTQVFVGRSSGLNRRGQTIEWAPLVPPLEGAADALAAPNFPAANRPVVDDWLAAIAEDREPACSGSAAMKSLEMIHAIFAAGLSHGRVTLPLSDRRHPLEPPP